MNKLGSLPCFLQDSDNFFKTFEAKPSEPFSLSGSRVFQNTVKKERPNTKLSQRYTISLVTENRPEGYAYQKDPKDIEDFLRIKSASATKRPASKQLVAKLGRSEIPVKSRVSCRRDPKETRIVLQKTVKMQERIRNELL